MKNIAWIAGGVALVSAIALGALLLKGKKQAPVANVDHERVEQNAELAERLDSAITNSVKSVPSKGKSHEASAEKDRQPAAVSAQAVGEKAKFEGAAELAEFAKLKSHVFLSDEGRARKRELLHDERFLKGLEGLLKTSANNDMQILEAQSQAIDLLIEARAAGSSEVAGEVLRSVVEDSSIENEKVNLSDRKALAGTKAELLYQWTAQEPLVAERVKDWLPGPVSKKIWNNVMHAQAQNELESLEEVKAAAASR